MNDKHRQVHDWLVTVFADEDVPDYEIQPSTIDLLHKLMLINRTQDRYAAILADDYVQKAAEYKMEADRLGGVLQRLGLAPASLSNSGTASLRTLVNVTDHLRVKDASDSSLLLGMSEMSQKMMKIRDARRREKKLSSQLLDKTKAALLHSNTLKKALQSLEEQSILQAPQLHKKSKQTGFLQSKGREYKKLISKREHDPVLQAADPSIYHGALVRKSEALQSLRNKLDPLKAKLDSYHQLPADTELTQVKVEEAKQELDRLEQQLAQHLDLMHM